MMKDANIQKMKHVFPITCALIVLCRTVLSMIERNHSLLDLSLFMYADTILVQYCHRAFQKLPPRQKSLRRWLLRVALFLLNSGIFIAIVLQSAPFYGPVTAAFLYAVAVGATAFVFYAYIIYDGDGNGDGELEKCQDLRFDYISEKL